MENDVYKKIGMEVIKRFKEAGLTETQIEQILKSTLYQVIDEKKKKL